MRGPVVVPLLALVLAGCGAASPSSSPVPSPTSDASPTLVASPSATKPSAQATPQPTAASVAWRRIEVDGRRPPAREDHTWTLTPDGATAYLFGGRTTRGEALADLWAFDLASGQWSRIEGRGPPARFGHNAVWADGIGLVIFAGQSSAAFYNDVWAFGPTAERWRKLPAGGSRPVARYGSCAAIGPDGRMWISHGFTAEQSRFADTLAYDFVTGTWSDETPPGEAPIARCLHACWWTPDSLVLYAGQTTGVTALGDLWRLTPGPRQGTSTWNEVRLRRGPAERNLYAAARWGKATVVVGGQALDRSLLSDAWRLDDAGRAMRIDVGGEEPPGRYGAEMIADRERGRLLLFGGRGADGALNDLWELTLTTR